MTKYKIQSTHLQQPIIFETESNDDAFTIFLAYCDYNQIDDDNIEIEKDGADVINAVAEQFGEDDEEDECIARFTFNKIK